MYCLYYQAQVLRKKTWFLSAALRNESNVAFARALEMDKSQRQDKKNIFEFFVPEDQEPHFLRVMNALQKKGIVLSFEKKENRLKVALGDA